MTIEHKNIADADLHEPKGAATATARDVLRSAGGGTTDFGPAITRTLVLDSASFVTQQPTALDTELQVSYGSPESNAFVSLAADGTITFLTAGSYELKFNGRLGRNTSAGVAVIGARSLVNNVPLPDPVAFKLTDDEIVLDVEFANESEFNVNDTLKVQIVRDSSGINQGGLFTDTLLATGWGATSSARIRLTKLESVEIATA